MTKLIQRSFLSGEVSPSMYPRVDFKAYQEGLKTCRNAWVQRHGGVQNRPGSQFIGEVNDSSDTIRLFPFVFNNDQTYVLEFGDSYFRVIKDGTYVSDLSLTITGITNANPGVVTYTGTDPSNGDEMAISGLAGDLGLNLNGRNFKIANVDTGANTFELQDMTSTNFNTTSLGSYTSGGTASRVYTVTTTYSDDDLKDITFVQSADVITMTHPDYVPREISRTADASWTISDITFGPSQAAVGTITWGGGGAVISGGGFGFTGTYYKITAISSSGEESNAAETYITSVEPDPADPIDLSWSFVTGAISYRIYRRTGGIYGLVSEGTGASFDDVGDEADITINPPEERGLFDATDDYPSAVTYYQQRLVLASTNDNPETVYTSKTANFKNFNVTSPISDDNPVTFTLAGREVNSVKHMLDLRRLIIFTTSGEFVVSGGGEGSALTPTSINSVQHSYNGSNFLRPLVINETAVYSQARGRRIRDLVFNFQTDGYAGNDLTINSSHLFEDYTITDWDYQKVPHSILWSVRSDGVLLGLTYLREQNVFAWHRHDFTDATIENVCVVPEGNEDALYIVAKRTIDGRSVKYVERLASRNPTENFYGPTITDTYLTSKVAYYKFMDSHLSFDGRNTNQSVTMTLSGGSTWESDEDLTLTHSVGSFFSSSDIGKKVHLSTTNGDIVRLTITAYTSASVVTVRSNREVPAALRSTASYVWGLGVSELSGLWHLEGEDVAVYADATVVGSPNNSSYDTYTVTNGQITLDDAYVVVHVGKPYTSDIETLDIDSSQIETLVDQGKAIYRTSMHVDDTRGLWAGSQPPTNDASDPLENLEELQIREDENYDNPVALATKVVHITVNGQWNDNGRVFLRQVDPLPMTVNSIAPSGVLIPGGK